MMKWWKKLGKDHKGFSLVELLCTMAIFSLVVTGVGTALVVSARSYQSGNVELDLQQQAQVTANLLTNLIIDSDKVEDASGSKLILKKNESGVEVTYTVELNGEEIRYSTSSGASGTLAENVEVFTVSQGEGGNVDFTLKFKEGTREYNSDYHVTPRNGITSGGAAMSGDASIFVENRLILEPGQEYDLNVRILGTSVQGFTVQNLSGHMDTTADTGTEVRVKDTSTVHIRVGLGETSESFHFEVKAADGSIAPQPVTVLVRRVNDIKVSGYKTGGTVNRAGATYKVTTSFLEGTNINPNLNKEPGSWFDVDYVNPYTVDWKFEFTKDGAMLPYESYIEETGRGVEGNVPYVTFKLKQDMTEGCSLKVTATALHPEGEFPVSSGTKTNKSGKKYGTVEGSWVLNYQAWRRYGKLNITVPLTERDFDSWGNVEDGTYGSLYKFAGRASVSYIGYNKFDIATTTSGGWESVNPFTTSTNNILNLQIPAMAHINQVWDLILNVRTDSGGKSYALSSYSTPYIGVDIIDQWAMGKTPNETGGYSGRYTRGEDCWIKWRDTSSVDIKVTYVHTLEDGTEETVVVSDTQMLEDVSVLYKNSASANWIRDNKVFVTVDDLIDEYSFYFKFDRGWDKGEDYYFHDLSRFVGVVYDAPGYINDVRKDIPISPAIPSLPDQYIGDSYITFVMDRAEKEKCYDTARPYGGVITEVYEYNPFLGMLNWGVRDYNGIEYDDLSWFVPLDNPYKQLFAEADTLTQDRVDQMKGCKGTLIFCFKDPNINVAAGAVTPIVRYCPTLTEYGSVYYIPYSGALAQQARFVIGTDTAEYQIYESGNWITKSNMTWDGTNWTAH